MLLVVGGGVIATVLLLGANMVSAHGFGFGLRGGDIADVPLEKLEKHAELLGISAEELTDSLEAGDSFGDIVEAQGLTKEDLRATHREHKAEWMAEKLSQMVEESKLTQEEADTKLERFGSGTWGDHKKDSHFGKGRFHGFGK